MPNVVAIGQTIAEIWPFLFFQDGDIFDFLKFEILTAGTVRRTNMRHSAKFRADLTICCRDMAIFDFFKDGGRPPSWIFKILIAKILIACRVKMANFRIFATFHGDPSNRC